MICTAPIPSNVLAVRDQFTQVTYSWSTLLFQTAFLLADTVLSMKTGTEAGQGRQAHTPTLQQSVPQWPWGKMVPAPAALAEQDKQKQNILCLENTPSYFYIQTRCFHFDETVQKIFFVCLFQCETDAAKNLESCSKEKLSFPGQLGQGDCQLQGLETNNKKYSCSQTAPLQFLTQLHSLLTLACPWASISSVEWTC